MTLKIKTAYFSIVSFTGPFTLDSIRWPESLSLRRLKSKKIQNKQRKIVKIYLCSRFMVDISVGLNMEDEDLLCLKNYTELFERQLW